MAGKIEKGFFVNDNDLGFALNWFTCVMVRLAIISVLLVVISTMAILMTCANVYTMLPKNDRIAIMNCFEIHIEGGFELDSLL